jgi:AraC-like DNA-binding protein
MEQREALQQREPLGEGCLLLPARRVREDALPENLEYADGGCDLWDRCLTCPLPRCRYDEPGGARQLFLRERDREIVRLYRGDGVSIDALARRFGISRRSVFRSLRRARGSRPPVRQARRAS